MNNWLEHVRRYQQAHPQLSYSECLKASKNSYKSGKGLQEDILEQYLPKDVVNHVIKQYIDQPTKKELLSLDQKVKELYANALEKLASLMLPKPVLDRKVRMLDKYLIYGNTNRLFSNLTKAKAIEFYDKLKLAIKAFKNLNAVKFFQ